MSSDRRGRMQVGVLHVTGCLHSSLTQARAPHSSLGDRTPATGGCLVDDCPRRRAEVPPRTPPRGQPPTAVTVSITRGLVPGSMTSFAADRPSRAALKRPGLLPARGTTLRAGHERRAVLVGEQPVPIGVDEHPGGAGAGRLVLVVDPELRPEHARRHRHRPEHVDRRSCPAPSCGSAQPSAWRTRRRTSGRSHGDRSSRPPGHYRTGSCRPVAAAERRCVSYMRTAARAPDIAVSAATTQTAVRMP